MGAPACTPAYYHGVSEAVYALITHRVTQGYHWVGACVCVREGYVRDTMGYTLGLPWGYMSDCMFLSVLLVTLCNILWLSFGSPTRYSVTSSSIQYPVVILWVTH